MFFDSADGLVRVLVFGVAAYAALVVLLRTSGKRTLAKLNAFDLVVTVALGSTLATVLLSPDVALAEGVLGLFTLVAAQFTVAWSAARWPRVARAVKAEPAVLVWQGAVIESELRRHRVAPEEVRQALRQRGIGSLDAVAALVLETDGTLSVLTDIGAGSASALVGVRNSQCREQAP